MTIEESIRCEVYRYDHTGSRYVLQYTLGESEIISASINRQCCAQGSFEIGGVYASTLSMVAKLSGMSLFQVRGAKIIVWSKYDTENDWCQMGTFWVTDATRSGEIFTLNAQDAVGWLDTVPDNRNQPVYSIPDRHTQYADLEALEQLYCKSE